MAAVKLVTYARPPSPGPRLGVLQGDEVLDLSGPLDVPDMLAFLQGGEALWDKARGAAAAGLGERSKLAGVRLAAPLARPGALRDFFAFEDHAKAGSLRRGEPLPELWYSLPAYYKGNHREILGPEDEIPWPSYTRKLDFECEVACVVGRPGRDLSPEEAAGHVFGYMIFNDVSARDIQKEEMSLRMGPAKGKDFANVFGPWLVTADEVEPEKDFEMVVRVNGEEWSRGHFKNQYWGFPLMLSHVSQAETVHPGDLLGSGTFHKGCGLDLDRWIQPGDVVELEVPALGVLRNRVGSPKAQRRLTYPRR